MSVPQTTNSSDIATVIANLASRQGNRPKGPAMSGPKRAAILMLALGEQYGGKVWSLLDDDEVRELSMHMSTLVTVEAEARARRAGARDPARGHGSRRDRPDAANGGGAEGSDRARRADASHRIHVEPVADPPPRRPRGDGRDLQQFRPPDRNPLHHVAGGGEPRVRRTHQGADVHLR